MKNKIFVFTAIGIFGLAVIPFFSLPRESVNAAMTSECQLLHTFNSGETLMLCSQAEDPATDTPSPTDTDTPAPTDTDTPAPTDTDTPSPTATDTATPTSAPVSIAPYRDAPLCADHDPNTFHTLWNSALGCHYDHEHGINPFVSEVNSAFPGFDLLALLGSVEIGHTNLTGPMENTMKHGGLKWNVQLQHPEGCKGFEGATVGVNGSVIQYHGFGDYAMELESDIHSTVALLRQCQESNPADYGYIYTVQHQTYGELCVPYQGIYFPYPHDSAPPYNCSFGQYLTVNCIEFVLPGATQQSPQCRRDLAFAQRANMVSQSNWSSKITGASNPSLREQGSSLFNLLFRVTDAPQNIDFRDRTHPYTFAWICSSNNGLTFNPAGCRKTNTTTQVHEIAGVIPSEWDNLEGFDTNPAAGRITAEGYTTRFGALNSTCTEPGVDCHPIKLINAFVGKYGSVLVFTNGKGVNIVPRNPSRNIYFCNGVLCSETSPGAVPSGWVGAEN